MGKSLTGEKNFYHKPISSFNWSWDINETSSLTTSAYISFGRGGGTGDIGRLEEILLVQAGSEIQILDWLNGMKL